MTDLPIRYSREQHSQETIRAEIIISFPSMVKIVKRSASRLCTCLTEDIIQEEKITSSLSSWFA